ncbi:hypothetical protein D4764_11G0002330 [Takifugu flavidus]|uniref:Uncharacterized protein n=1 Tax=Takifugu flavidus TaxID=433684 RepID=A0A5C6PEE3_9TELE|nr:hypothetical protein D4764_11G0002330 [Takifugu flavidus]
MHHFSTQRERRRGRTGRGEERRGEERRRGERGEERRRGEEERRGEETISQWGDRGLSACNISVSPALRSSTSSTLVSIIHGPWKDQTPRKDKLEELFPIVRVEEPVIQQTIPLHNMVRIAISHRAANAPFHQQPPG